MRNKMTSLIVTTLALVAGAILPVVAAAPLTDEDIVRLFVQGKSTEELIALIGSSEVEFDLEEEMLAELRIAGIPGELLDAMLARQTELTPAPVEAATAEELLLPRLVIRLNPDSDEPQLLRSFDEVDPQMAQTLELRNPEARITDLGIVLLCTTGDHVPDHWRGQSPLGRDFIATPRHRLLAFITGAEAKPTGKLRNKVSKLGLVAGQREAAPDLQLLELAVPATIEVELESGIEHELMLGIALQIDGRFYLTRSDRRVRFLLAEEGATTLSAELSSASKQPLRTKVEFLDSDDDAR